ncbi:MAG: DUF2520 domain-containing protein [Chitinophagales bacterium]
MKFAVVGTGKAATALTGALLKAGHELVMGWAHTVASGEAFRKQFDSKVVYDLRELVPTDLVLIAVKDDVVEQVMASFPSSNAIVVLISGFAAAAPLSKYTRNYGIFYPFVSMTKDTVDFSEVLFMIEGSNEGTTNQLREWALTITGTIQITNIDQRRQLHLAAVVAQNFSNHLNYIASKLLEEKGLSFDLIKPLLQRYVETLQQQSPVNLQTGPAIRGDVATIAQHEKMLDHHPQWQQLYRWFTEQIQNTAARQ